MQYAHDSSNHESSGDEGLELAVRDAISRSEPLRAVGLEALEVEASAGRVVLRGNVANMAHKYVAEKLARSVRGVKEVDNRLITAEEMESDISSALAADPATRHLRIAVRVVGKAAALFGAVATEDELKRAGEVAASAVPGFVVENRIHLLPAGEPALLLWQQSVEGRRLVEQMKAAKASEDVVEEAEAGFEPAPPAAPSEARHVTPAGGMA